MFKIALIEDEKRARQACRSLVEKMFPNVYICGEASNLSEAVRLVKSEKPNLLLLDIRLKGENSFDLFDQIDTTNLSVIFITAFSEYAIKAIKLSAVDYLLKPIDPEELKKAIEGAMEIKNNSMEKRFEVLESFMERSKSEEQKIVLSDSNKFHVVKLSEIIRCEGEKNYTTFYLTSGENVVTTKSLIEYDKMLSGYNFYRVFKSHLINLIHVNGMKRGKSAEVIMTDGSSVAISRDKKTDFLEIIKEQQNLI